MDHRSEHAVEELTEFDTFFERCRRTTGLRFASKEKLRSLGFRYEFAARSPLNQVAVGCHIIRLAGVVARVNRVDDIEARVISDANESLGNADLVFICLVHCEYAS